MERRGPKRFEEKVGEDRFKQLLTKLGPKEIAKLYCDHFLEEKDKAKCEACQRAIYRAKKRIEKKRRAKKGLEPMATFRDIPEVQTFIEHEKHKKSVNVEVRQLERMWNWIKESNLKNLSRPALWDINHIRLVLDKVKELEVAPYSWKQTLRRLFESQDSKLQKHKLIKARRRDMRSPKGVRRTITTFPPSLLPKIWEALDPEEKLAVDLHITVKSREGDRGKGSLLDIQWKHINWADSFYGFSMVTVEVYEPKTSGGTWWRHIPVDLWFADLSERLRAKHDRLGKPKEGYVLDFSYDQYLKIWEKISWFVEQKYEPHDCRRSPSSWLRDLGLDGLALGQYNPSSGQAIGYTGVGWENSEIYYQRYGKMNPKAIFNAELKLDRAIFTGLINRILEERAK